MLLMFLYGKPNVSIKRPTWLAASFFKKAHFFWNVIGNIPKKKINVFPKEKNESFIVCQKDNHKPYFDWIKIKNMKKRIYTFQKEKKKKIVAQF